MSRYRLGIDIGGTFTDATLVDESTGDVRIEKVPSTPSDPSTGFIEATRKILRESEVDASQVGYVVHATTVATNSIIEGKIARTGFVTTDGFRDMLEIGRQIRPSLYDLMFEKPPPLVPRYLCFGVRERLDPLGQVLLPLEEEAVRAVALRLKEEGVQAVAVCFLHSYLNGEHERRVREIIREALPDAVVSLSAEVAPEYREYYRASTTVINAAVSPLVSRYLRNIESQLRESGLHGELLIMQSSGGVYTSDSAQEKPVFMVESGPAAGVIAATELGNSLGYRNVISLDMGGTTAKTCLIQNGNPRVTKDYEVGAKAAPGMGSGRGSGYPIRTPVIDLVEIGAGGGSIAWIDPGGILRVGPQSAGADPGPVCYGRGGTEPTITDANLVLGRLNPHYFLGGGITLDVEGARRATEERCAGPLGIGVVEAAYGIVEIANTAMMNALRLVSVQHGYDPRDFALMAFGGAGPVHANRLADEMEIVTTLVPPAPGIACATGLLSTDLKRDYSISMIQRVDSTDPAELDAAYRKLEEQGAAELRKEGVTLENLGFIRQIDMRYRGQSYELTVPMPDGALGREELASVVKLFDTEHDRTYGFSAPGEPTEFVTLRLTAVGRIQKPQLRRLAARNGGTNGAQKGSRSVYFGEAGDFVATPLYDRYQLGPGTAIEGPAVIEEFDSTTVLHPGYQAVVDEFGVLHLTRKGSTAVGG